MTPACMEFVSKALIAYPCSGRVLELGSYDVNGSVRPLFKPPRFTEYVGMDMREGPGVDFVCTTSQPLRMWPAGQFGVIVTTEMLEHDKHFWQTLGLCRVKLVGNGHLIVTTRNIGFKRHDYPSDYYRFTGDGIRAVLEWAGFEVLKAEDDEEDQGTFAVARKIA